ncbi:Serpentine Receptor, class H [Caenorhabditis elegans]|uniref:Serpentine Receptor, class H n=1 Tax=Caenorhabditis elegans TaxID=6239 RepID=Q19814_CAEEL|nr:Serpentine Receptor, class H [Caenorhabditis elegans]CCD62683.1 Serpentine Receptor, class H [Caenorhabditis elegans]|eukprot:NP_001023859.1 Serpentine Receptor, class H [Caenorhabditis elegans]
MCLQSLLTSTLLTPITWLPTIGSSMMGLFSYIGVPETVQFYLFVIVMFVTMSSVVSPFENRHNAIQHNTLRISTSWFSDSIFV